MEGRMERDSCLGCRHHLGGGCCRINLELECAAGGFEAWEEARESVHGRKEGGKDEQYSEGRGDV